VAAEAADGTVLNLTRSLDRELGPVSMVDYHRTAGDLLQDKLLEDPCAGPPLLDCTHRPPTQSVSHQMYFLTRQGNPG
jgi:hypothetical protein